MHDDETDDLVAGEVDGDGGGGLPAEYTEPSDNVTDEPLATSRCEFRDPVILSTRGRRPDIC